MLSSSETAQEITYSSVTPQSNGFVISGAESRVNESGLTYVGWTWKAGGNSNTFNIDDVGYASASAAGLDGGTITPTGASVNTKSGFSIVKWDGSGSSGTLSHGLGRTPGFILLKGTSAGEDGQNWRTYHSVLGTSPSNTLFINLTNASQSNTERISAVGADTFTLSSGGAGVNVSGQSYITYIWAEIPGFSKFGSYVSNGITDGNFVELGFKPAVVIIKSADYSASNTSWAIYTSDLYPNQYQNALFANKASAEGVRGDGTSTGSMNQQAVDLLSNGFKLRNNGSETNEGSSNVYIYAAWAEAPTFNLYGAQANAR